MAKLSHAEKVEAEVSKINVRREASKQVEDAARQDGTHYVTLMQRGIDRSFGAMVARRVSGHVEALATVAAQQSGVTLDAVPAAKALTPSVNAEGDTTDAVS